MRPEISGSTEIFSTFGIDIRRNRLEANEIPPQLTARETLNDLALHEDHEAIADITQAAAEISKVVRIERKDPDGDDLELLDLFTAVQIQGMHGRMRTYLDKDLDTHLSEPAMPRGYPLYVGRLAAYLALSSDAVTSNFSRFESRHTNPTDRATGPYEVNSREYANRVNDLILSQLRGYYQANFDVKLVGPMKPIEDGKTDWERGVAECQFLVLDYIRDCLSGTHQSTTNVHEQTVMTVEDIAHNIAILTLNRNHIVARASAINPFLAEQIDSAITLIAYYGLETFHRGRPSVPRYRKDPEKARAAIHHLETLLETAVLYEETSSDQEDIPILDF